MKGGTSPPRNEQFLIGPFDPVFEVDLFDSSVGRAIVPPDVDHSVGKDELDLGLPDIFRRKRGGIRFLKDLAEQTNCFAGFPFARGDAIMEVIFTQQGGTYL